jgi:hypothetical protein
MSSVDVGLRRNALDRRQREHELTEALTAARHLQARLEMLGDRQAEVRELLLLRNDLATELAGLAGDLSLPPRIVLASDDVDEDDQPLEWNAYWLAQAAGEVDR